MLDTAYQYNHQSGTLHLPLCAGGTSPVAIKARMLHALLHTTCGLRHTSNNMHASSSDL